MKKIILLFIVGIIAQYDKNLSNLSKTENKQRQKNGNGDQQLQAASSQRMTQMMTTTSTLITVGGSNYSGSRTEVGIFRIFWKILNFS